MSLKLYTTSPTVAPTKSSIFLWNILAFQAGSLNVGGFLACQRFVTHVTGFATMFGTELAQKRDTQALGYLSVPLFFLAGAMISAVFIDRKIQAQKPPQYYLSFGILVLITGSVLAMGVTNHYGTFGAPLEFGRDYSLLALLCLASGIQNATVTSAYGSVVRTTHLTGLTTDLGIGFVRLLSSVGVEKLNPREVHATFMRLSIILAFTLGSVFSGFIFTEVAYWGFLIPFVISLGLWLYSLGLFKKTRQIK